MPAKFVIFMALLTSGSANPHHGLDIQVNIEQKVNIGCVSLCTEMGGNCQAPDDSCSGMSINNKTLGREKYCKTYDNCYACCAPSGNVYTADIENSISLALRSLIFYNMSSGNQTKSFTPTKCAALKEFIRIIHRYLKPNVHIQEHTYKFIKQLHTKLNTWGICSAPHTVSVVQGWLNDIQKGPPSDGFINGEWQPSVSCHNIDGGDCFWRYTCGLWNIFHTLTVSAENSGKPLEVLKAIRGYVINFLGCYHCRNDFQTMYEQTIVTHKKVDTTEKAIWWLWCAHNKVNKRTTIFGTGGNATTGKHHGNVLPPHPPFPLHSACPWCWERDVNKPEDDYTNCAKLFCKSKDNPDSNFCFHTKTDPQNINYDYFSKSSVLSYLKSTYRGPYSFLKTNNVWQQIDFKFKVVCKIYD